MVINMKTAAVIAEYNPFHNGHLYQFNTIKNILGADRIIVIMSGNFTQRGLPAIVDKYSRCKMALENGADAVFELPVYFATGSAEYFAQGAISLIDKLGVVDILHFGSEEGDINTLVNCAQILSKEPDTYKNNLNMYLKKGLSFPSAQAKALAIELSGIDKNVNIENIISSLSMPNNTLGIEYIKALLQRNSTITPITLKREGNQYHELHLSDDQFASANAIRTFLSELAANSNASPTTLESDTLNISAIQNQMPQRVYDYFIKQSRQEFLFSDDFSTVLYYKLLSELQINGNLEQYYDISTQINDIIKKNVSAFTSFSDFCLACKSKNLTYNRIHRCLTHVLLDLKKEQIQEYKANDYTSYARLLGFTENGKEILKAIKSHSSIPIITKLTKAEKSLDNPSSLKADIYASQLYYMIQGQKYSHVAKNEYTQEIVRC